MLTIMTPQREQDKHGEGAWGAPRGSRIHRGIDYAAVPESILLSPVAGFVTKLGFPYGDDLTYRYVEVTDRGGLRHRFFYVEPLVQLGDRIKKEYQLGIVQRLGRRYPGITEHIHYEIKDRDNNYIEPFRGY